jgi:hypothetical protein
LLAGHCLRRARITECSHTCGAGRSGRPTQPDRSRGEGGLDQEVAASATTKVTSMTPLRHIVDGVAQKHTSNRALASRHYVCYEREWRLCPAYGASRSPLTARTKAVCALGRRSAWVNRPPQVFPSAPCECPSAGPRSGIRAPCLSHAYRCFAARGTPPAVMGSAGQRTAA